MGRLVSVQLAQLLPALQLEGLLGFVFYSSRLKFSTISIRDSKFSFSAGPGKFCGKPRASPEEVGEPKCIQSNFRVIPQLHSPRSSGTLIPLDESVLGQETRLRAALGQVIASSVHLGRCAGRSSTMRGQVRGNMTQQVSKGSQGIWADCQRALLLLSINDLSWIIRRHI